VERRDEGGEVEELTNFDIDFVEQQWSDIHQWERRLNEYCDDIQGIMLKLGIPLQNPDTSTLSSSNWTGPDTDYQCLRMQLLTLRHRAEQRNAATTGLASIPGDRQSHEEQQLSLGEEELSLQEAQRTKALTLVGQVFIPLAYTATLFSMNERHMPEASNFWIYFSLSVPLIVAVILAHIILDSVYRGDVLMLLGWSKLKRNLALQKSAPDGHARLARV
jgi:CorA-like Mg2+ transporter protein